LSPLIRIYAEVYALIKQLTGRNLPGLGFLLRRCKKDGVLQISGRRMFFDHRIAPSYGVLIIGKWNEPETHLFFKKVLPSITRDFLFIDVGANVGEMVLDVSGYSNCIGIVAFEPISECAEVIRKTSELNNVEHVTVVNKAVSSTNGAVRFGFNISSPSGSHVVSDSDCTTRNVSACTLDQSFQEYSGNAVILIDVEGLELEVLKGGSSLFERTRPLIIFEYNSISKEGFTIKDVQKTLGNGYSIYRLREDARLDRDFSNSWNAVAIHHNSIFKSICEDLVIL